MPVSDLLVRGRFSGGLPVGDASGAVCAASQSWLSGKRCSCLVNLVREVEGINSFSLMGNMFMEHLLCASFCEVLGMREK